MFELVKATTVVVLGLGASIAVARWAEAAAEVKRRTMIEGERQAMVAEAMRQEDA